MGRVECNCEIIRPSFILRSAIITVSVEVASPTTELRWQGRNVRNVPARVKDFGGTALKGPETRRILPLGVFLF